MSSSDPIRAIVVDDTDAQINYKGNWKVDNGALLDGVGTYGPTYNHTSHGASESGASMSFSFVGTSVIVFGTNQTLPDFLWECRVDGIKTTPAPKPSQVENNWKLCEASSMRGNTHTIDVNILAASNAGTLWIDSIRYTPLPNATFANDVVIYVPSDDPGIKYSAGWASFPGPPSVDSSRFSQSLNANVEFTFVGTRFQWTGWYLKTFKHNPATATMTVDGSLSRSFPIGDTPDTLVTLPNRVFYTTPILDPGRHTVVVTYNGGPGDAPSPLSLGFFRITGTSISASIDAPSTPPQSSDTPTTITSTPSAPHSQPPIGAIVGGVVGGLALIVLALIALLFLRSRQKRRVKEDSEPPPPEPFLLTTARPPAPSSSVSRSTKEYAHTSTSESFLMTPATTSTVSESRVSKSRIELPPSYTLH